jgi:hypothetical protein
VRHDPNLAIDTIKGLLVAALVKYPDRLGAEPRWRTQSVEYHLEKVHTHIMAHKHGILRDPETKFPSLAHAAARLLMALEIHLTRA